MPKTPLLQTRFYRCLETICRGVWDSVCLQKLIYRGGPNFRRLYKWFLRICKSDKKIANKNFLIWESPARSEPTPRGSASRKIHICVAAWRIKLRNSSLSIALLSMHLKVTCKFLFVFTLLNILIHI